MTADTPPRDDRFARREGEGDDFPFYEGRPVRIPTAGWWLVMVAAAVGYLQLVLPPPVLRGPVTQVVPAILFFAIPLGALAVVAPRGWTAIFRPVRRRDICLMGVFALVNIAVTMAAGMIMVRVIETTGNPVVSAFGGQSGPERALALLRTLPQLFGEEVLSILPFLALMTWLVGSPGRTWRLSRRTGIVVALVLTAVLFAAVHLPTYDWNVAQVLGGVGVARIVLTLAYVVTKNIWVSTGAHVLTDWAFLALVAALGEPPLPGEV